MAEATLPWFCSALLRFAFSLVLQIASRNTGSCSLWKVNHPCASVSLARKAQLAPPVSGNQITGVRVCGHKHLHGQPDHYLTSYPQRLDDRHRRTPLPEHHALNAYGTRHRITSVTSRWTLYCPALLIPLGGLLCQCSVRHHSACGHHSWLIVKTIPGCAKDAFLSESPSPYPGIRRDIPSLEAPCPCASASEVG